MVPTESLTLAAIVYRGCEFNLANAHSRKLVYDEVARCLQTYGPVAGKWEIVWGPSGYRPALAKPDNIDISAMCVVRGIGGAPTLGIVIRGTNFFSPLDWLSNLLIDQKQWEYGGAGGEVKITHSTWLGLRILQRLKSGPVPAPDATQTPPEEAQARATAAQASIVYDLLKNTIDGNAPFTGGLTLTKIAAQVAASRALPGGYEQAL